MAMENGQADRQREASIAPKLTQQQAPGSTAFPSNIAQSWAIALCLLKRARVGRHESKLLGRRIEPWEAQAVGWFGVGGCDTSH